LRINPQILNKSDTNEILTQLFQQKFAFLERLDDQYRPVFLTWAGRRFFTTPNDLEDAWQDSLLVFYENVMSGKLKSLECSVQTYLFAVAGRHLLNENRKMRRFIWQDDAHKLMQEMPVSIENESEKEREILQKALGQISDKCRKLLIARHFDGFSVPEIKENFQFASENATSVHLSTCLAGLKKIIQTTLIQNGK
jgi:RNA polymerase sigma factor (sigma-70 family)